MSVATEVAPDTEDPTPMGPNEAVQDDPSPSYPIYYLSAKWVEPGGADNFGGTYRMFREPPSEQELQEALMTLMEGYRERRDVEAVLHLEAEYKYHETWVVRWFGHHTFDVGQSDREALASFRRYVDRHRWYQEPGVTSGAMKERVRERLGHDPVTLMGAEDRHRWTATPEGSGLMGPGEGQSDPPCRCEHCQEQGVLRIDH